MGAKQTTSEKRNCYHCGGEIHAYASWAAKGYGKYCSVPCLNMGKSLYPRILALLPATQFDLAEKLALPAKKVSQSIGRMAKRDLLHPVGVVPRDSKGSKYEINVALLLEAGPPTDASIPRQLNRALPHLISKAILAVMPASAALIVEKTGISETTVATRLQQMRTVVNETGWQQICFIRSYKRTLGRGGAFVPVYDRGPGKDQPCKIKRQTSQEKYRRALRSLDRRAKKVEQAQKALERRRRRVADRRIVEQGDPMLNAFFGSPADRRMKERRTEG